jgi:membrane associated rhomboid family serine protease
VRYQLRHAPGLRFRLYRRSPEYHRRVPLAGLFSLITVAFAGIAVYSATASQWPIAVASGALAAWMGSLAYSALRRTRF